MTRQSETLGASKVFYSTVYNLNELRSNRIENLKRISQSNFNSYEDVTPNLKKRVEETHLYQSDPVKNLDIRKPREIDMVGLGKRNRKLNKADEGTVRIYKVTDYYSEDPKEAEIIFYKSKDGLHRQIIRSGQNFQEGLLSKTKDELELYFYWADCLMNFFKKSPDLLNKDDQSSSYSELIKLITRFKNPDRNLIEYVHQDFNDLKKVIVDLYLGNKDNTGLKEVFFDESKINQFKDRAQQEYQYEELSCVINAQRYVARIEKEKQQQSTADKPQFNLGISALTKPGVGHDNSFVHYEINRGVLHKEFDAKKDSENICYVKIKKTSSDSSVRNHRTITIKDDEGLDHEVKDAYCFVKIEFNEDGTATLDDRFIYYSQKGNPREKKEVLLHEIDQVSQRALLEDLEKMTITVNNNKLYTQRSGEELNFRIESQKKDITGIKEKFQSKSRRIIEYMTSIAPKEKKRMLGNAFRSFQNYAEEAKKLKANEDTIKTKLDEGRKALFFKAFKDVVNKEQEKERKIAELSKRINSETLTSAFAGYRREVVRRVKMRRAVSSKVSTSNQGILRSAFSGFREGVEKRKKIKEISEKILGKNKQKSLRDVFNDYRGAISRDKRERELKKEVTLVDICKNEFTHLNESHKGQNLSKIGNFSRENAPSVDKLIDLYDQKELAKFVVKKLFYGLQSQNSSSPSRAVKDPELTDLSAKVEQVGESVKEIFKDFKIFKELKTEGLITSEGLFESYSEDNYKKLQKILNKFKGEEQQDSSDQSKEQKYKSDLSSLFENVGFKDSSFSSDKDIHKALVDKIGRRFKELIKEGEFPKDPFINSCMQINLALAKSLEINNQTKLTLSSSEHLGFVLKTSGRDQGRDNDYSARGYLSDSSSEDEYSSEEDVKSFHERKSQALSSDRRGRPLTPTGGGKSPLSSPSPRGGSQLVGADRVQSQQGY